MYTDAIELDQAAFDEWIRTAEASHIHRDAYRIFGKRVKARKRADFLISALRMAFRFGFVAGRSNIRPNGGTLLPQEPLPEIPF